MNKTGRIECESSSPLDSMVVIADLQRQLAESNELLRKANKRCGRLGGALAAMSMRVEPMMTTIERMRNVARTAWFLYISADNDAGVDASTYVFNKAMRDMYLTCSWVNEQLPLLDELQSLRKDNERLNGLLKRWESIYNTEHKVDEALGTPQEKKSIGLCDRIHTEPGD